MNTATKAQTITVVACSAALLYAHYKVVKLERKIAADERRMAEDRERFNIGNIQH